MFADHFPDQFNRRNLERKAEAIREIKDGNASPTIEFATEGDGDAFHALRTLIIDMSPDQRDHFKNGLKKFRAAIVGDLHERRDVEDTWQGLMPIVGLVLGGASEFGLGIPGFTAAGMLSGWSLRVFLERLTKKQRRILIDRLDRCAQLLSEARTTHGDTFRLPESDSGDH